MASPVTNFEIYAIDTQALSVFYQRVFEWKINKAVGVDYYLVETNDAEGRGIRGGILNRPFLNPKSWINYVTVESLEETLEKIKESNGKILKDKTAVPKTGWYAIAEDPQGNIFGLWQKDIYAFPPLEPE